MAAANASARGQRAAILSSPLHEFSGFLLAVDCCGPECRGELSFAIAELANFYGRDRTVGQVLRRMRCSALAAGTHQRRPQAGRRHRLRVPERDGQGEDSPGSGACRPHRSRVEGLVSPLVPDLLRPSMERWLSGRRRRSSRPPRCACSVVGSRP
jgi:hypothetical protein